MTRTGTAEPLFQTPTDVDQPPQLLPIQCPRHPPLEGEETHDRPPKTMLLDEGCSPLRERVQTGKPSTSPKLALVFRRSGIPEVRFSFQASEVSV